jgi:hypothetical protein
VSGVTETTTVATLAILQELGLPKDATEHDVLGAIQGRVHGKKRKTQKFVVAVAGFPYSAQEEQPNGAVVIVHRFAARGDEVELYDETEIARAEKYGYLVKPGEKVPGTPAPLGLDEIGLMTDDQLDDLWRNDRPTVKDTLSAVGDDPELANRILDVETGSGLEPRASLVEKLEAIANNEGGD